MALTLPQISELETSKKTGQPQDIAAMIAMLMGGVDLGLGTSDTPTDPLTGNNPNAVPTQAPDTISPLVGASPTLDFFGGGGASGGGASGGGGVNEGPTSPPGPGPNTPEGLAQQVIDAVMSGKDPTSIVNDAIAQNQQEAGVAQNVATAAGIGANPVTGTLSFLGGQLGGRPGSQIGGALGKAAQTGLNFMGVNIPSNPASPVFSLVNILANILAQNNLQQAGRIAQANTPNNLNFLGVNANPSGRGLDPNEPSGLGGPGAPEGPGSPTGPTGGPTGPGQGPGGPTIGTPGQGPNSGIGITDPSTAGGMLADPTNQGLNVDVGPVGPDAGAPGDGPSGSLLANFATGNRPPRQMHDFYKQFMGAHPRDGKKLFTAYQTVAKQVIARAKHRGQEDYLRDRMHAEFVDPISYHIDNGDVDMATDTVVRTTKDLAREYHVPIPDRYESVLNRQSRGGDV